MDLYGQDGETRLLAAFARLLDCPTMIDVGAERGALAEAMLAAGIERLHAIEPHPGNAHVLRARFAGESRVTVHEVALGDHDGAALLRLSERPDGTPITFGHTLIERHGTNEIRWPTAIPVHVRSLASLIESEEIPRRAGILKVDTEGSDLAVLVGMGDLDVDIVMVEHWLELPKSLGVCQWTIAELTQLLRERHFEHFAFIVHRGEFVTLKWDDGSIEAGAMGNLVFLRDRVLQTLLPATLECAGWLAENAVAVGQMYMKAANERLALVERLHAAANETTVPAPSALGSG